LGISGISSGFVASDLLAALLFVVSALEFDEVLLEDVSLLKSDTPTMAQTANTIIVEMTRIGVQNVVSGIVVSLELIKL
jgi:hypothetical protein